MGTTLNGIVAKIARAHEHFETLRSEFRTARDRREYGLLTDVDPMTGEMAFRVRFPYALRRRWGAMVGDIAHDLRSAIDQLVFQLAIVNGANPEGWNTSFPICNSAEIFAARIGRSLRGVSEEARGRIERAQPYHAGTDLARHPLLHLRELSNSDKHRVPSLAAIHRLGGVVSLRGQDIPAPPEPVFGDSQDEAEWFRAPDGVEVKFNLVLQIRFNEGPLRGEEVEELLYSLIGFVQGLIEQDFMPFFPEQRHWRRFGTTRSSAPRVTLTTERCKTTERCNWIVHDVTALGFELFHAAPVPHDGHADSEEIERSVEIRWRLPLRMGGPPTVSLQTGECAHWTIENATADGYDLVHRGWPDHGDPRREFEWKP